MLPATESTPGKGKLVIPFLPPVLPGTGLFEAYARHHRLDKEGAWAEVFDHAPSLRRGELRPVRVRLVAEAFGPSVTTNVLWMREVGLDIGCIGVSPGRLPDGGYVVTARQLLPLPAAEHYLVKRRRREKAEEEYEAPGRNRNTVTMLLEAKAIEPGTELKLNFITVQGARRALQNRARFDRHDRCATPFGTRRAGTETTPRPPGGAGPPPSRSAKAGRWRCASRKSPAQCSARPASGRSRRPWRRCQRYRRASASSPDLRLARTDPRLGEDTRHHGVEDLPFFLLRVVT